jgi:hypothetical protein
MAKLVFGAPGDFAVELEESADRYAEVPRVRIVCVGTGSAEADFCTRQGWKNAAAPICVCFGGGAEGERLMHQGAPTPSGKRTCGELKPSVLPVPAAGGALSEALRIGALSTWKPHALHAGFWEALKSVSDANELDTDEKVDAHADALVRALHTIMQANPEQVVHAAARRFSDDFQ